jgi:hypothetical protein
MMSFVNILFLWNSFGFWQFALTPLDYETNALPTEPLRLVEDYQFYFYERNSVIGVAFIVFPVTKFQKFSILFGIDDMHTVQNFKNFPFFLVLMIHIQVYIIIHLSFGIFWFHKI